MALITLEPYQIQTYTGKVMDVRLLDPEDIDIQDIAHALALLNRYTGHTLIPYSVAQHSVAVSRMVEDQHAKWGLMHDATEAYLGDVARPLKALLPEYKRLEHLAGQAIAQRFGLEWPIPPEVKAADNVALMAEKRDLMAYQFDWGVWATETPHPDRIVPVSWQQAESDFVDRFFELWPQ